MVSAPDAGERDATALGCYHVLSFELVEFAFHTSESLPP